MPKPAAHDDHYRVLGISEDASPEDVKRAYRARAREHHPDSGGDAEAFKRVREAYEVLGDPARRARYDRRNEPRTGGPFVGSFWRNAGTPAGGAPPPASGGKDLDLEDIFNDFSNVGGFGFGAAGSTRAGRNGAGAAGGADGRTHGPARPTGPTPQGGRPQGARPSSRVHVRASEEDGGGARPPRNEGFGDMPGAGWRSRGPDIPEAERPGAARPDRRGAEADPEGSPVRDPSTGADVHVAAHVPADVAERGGTVTLAYRRMRRSDDGRSFAPADELHELRVPPGTTDGEALRVPRLGDMAPGGPGDLVARVKIVPAREGGRMKMPPRPPPAEPGAAEAAAPPAGDVQRVDVDVMDALLGGVVEVPTAAGPARVRIPAGTSSGARLVLRGRGAGGADVVAEVRIVVPRALSEEARSAAERLAALLRT